MKTIVVQAGHVAPREPGFESGTGTYREQEFTASLQLAMQSVFAKDSRFKFVAVPGRIPRGTLADAFISLHLDGSSNKSASGFCFGYPIHQINQKLAQLLAEEYVKIPGHPPKRADNYTADLRGYYGFSRISSAGPEVLFEHGFATNPGESLWLFANISRIAQAEYVAVCRFFGYLPYAEEQRRKRLAALRQWILARRAERWGWEKIKTYGRKPGERFGPNWREWIRLGGK